MRWRAFPLDPKENDIVEMNKFLFCPLTLHVGNSVNAETRWLETTKIVYKYTHYREYNSREQQYYTYGWWKPDHWYINESF